MALLSVIRRCHYCDHLSTREIANRSGLSRNSVRQYLRSDIVEPRFKMTFGSFSKVARHITGMRWDGPRFFSLRQENVR